MLLTTVDVAKKNERVQNDLELKTQQLDAAKTKIDLLTNGDVGAFVRRYMIYAHHFDCQPPINKLQIEHETLTRDYAKFGKHGGQLGSNKTKLLRTLALLKEELARGGKILCWSFRERLSTR